MQRWVDYRALLDLLVRKDHKVLKARRGHKVLKEFVLHVLQVNKVLPVHKAPKDRKVLKVHKVLKALKVLLQQFHLHFCAAL
ncbi:hypothetical protein [Paenibacillus sp. NPDC058071]|uniref:hypothetical protein n=1 Tax=Paenibacillus sp. NPDC058071 TaxID=3346326 RepID=UPI0036D92EE1